jgi:hypothetical protein
LERNEPDPIIFVGEVGPNHIVEYVVFNGIDCKWECSETFRSRCVVKGCCIDSETGKMIKVGMSDQVCSDVFSYNMNGIGPS